MVYIAYVTELNLQICHYMQKQRICRENCKYALNENLHGHFCPRRKAAKFCHPDDNNNDKGQNAGHQQNCTIVPNLPPPHQAVAPHQVVSYLAIGISSIKDQV